MTTPSPITLRPLEVEVEAMLGWNDGVSLNVVEHAGNDGMVFHHERIHGTLIYITVDGTVFRFLQLAAPRLPNPRESAELAHTARYLFDGSRFAHEAAATYLGIMHLETREERDASRQRLPVQYCEYYDFMSAIVDTHCQASFLRVLIGQSIAHFWFSSRALLVLASNDYRGTSIMAEEFCPNWRARTSAPWLTEVGVKTAIAESIRQILEHKSLCEKIGVSNADDLVRLWNDDAWWVGLDLNAAGFVEELVSRVSFGVFLEKSGLNSAPELLIRNNESGAQLLKPLLDRAHVQLMNVQEDHRESPSAPLSVVAALREFTVLARTVSHIQPRAETMIVAGNRMLGLSDLDSMLRRHSVVDILLPEAETADNAWICEYTQAEPDGGSPSRWTLSNIHCCRSQLAIELLRRIMQNRIARKPGLDVDCVVIPTSFEDIISTYKSLLEHLAERTPEPTTSHSYASPTLAFIAAQAKEFLHLYVRDDWERIVGATEKTRPPTQIGFTEVVIDGRETFMINVARIDGLPCNLLKAYPNPASPIIFLYYQSCFAAAELLEFGNELDGPEVLRRASRAFIACSLAWRRV